jgi:hypothetical protein
MKKADGPSESTLNLGFDDGKVLLKRDFAVCEELYKAPWLCVQPF